MVTTGRIELLEHEQRCHIRQGRRTICGTRDRPEQRTAYAAAESAGATGPSRDYSPAGAADAAADSTVAAVSSQGLLAGRTCGRTKLEYTAELGRHDHATLWAWYPFLLLMRILF